MGYTPLYVCRNHNVWLQKIKGERVRAVVGFGKMVRPVNAMGIPQGPKARVGGEHERGEFPLLVRGFGGFPPKKIFKFKISVEVILIHFETIFACEIRLNVQAFHVELCIQTCFERHH